MKTYLLMDAQTREPVGAYVTGEASMLQVGTRLPAEPPGDAPREWEVLATVEDETEKPVAFVRPAAV